MQKEHSDEEMSGYTVSSLRAVRHCHIPFAFMVCSFFAACSPGLVYLGPNLVYVDVCFFNTYHSTHPVTGGDWVLAFRAVKENNVSVFNTWNDWSLQHDNPVLDSFPHACLRLVNTRSCDRHFRSQILENWTNIKEVWEKIE